MLFILNVPRVQNNLPQQKLDSSEPTGKTALQRAARNGNKKLVELLLDRGAGIDIQRGWPGGTPLHLAAQRGHEPIVELLVKRGADVNVKWEGYPAGDTPLHSAARAGHKEVVRLLVTKGADVNVKNHAGQTPVDLAIGGNHTSAVKLLMDSGGMVGNLHSAVRIGSREQVQSLVQQGADLNAKDNWGQRPLHRAISMRRRDIVEILVAGGADIEATNSQGMTALHQAVAVMDTEVAKLLVAKGANVNAETMQGWTPLFYARSANNREIMELLEAQGAVFEISTIHMAAQLGAVERVKAFLDQGADIDARDSEGQTALHIAAQAGRKEVAELLIARGADVNAGGAHGYTSLYSAIWKNDPNMVGLLVSKGADVHFSPEDDYSPLHYAVWTENLEIVKVLVDNGADCDVKDQDGWTAFRYAADEANREIIELFVANGADVSGIHRAACLGNVARVKALLEQGTDIDEKDEAGWTPLYWACSMGQEGVAEFLLSKGARADAKTEGENTPLQAACYSGAYQLVELLVSKGADVNAKDKSGRTPLHSAATVGSREIVELLIGKGADVNVKNRANWTALHRAAIGGHTDVAKLLISHGADTTAEDSRGRTALQWAEQRGHTEIVELLLNDKSAVTSALLPAVKKGDMQFVKELLDRGADVNIRDDFGLTALHHAVAEGHKEIVVMLLERDTHVDIRDNAGRAPIHYAAEATYWKDDRQDLSVEMIRLLADAGSDIDVQDAKGWTPLHYVAHNRKIYLIEELLKMGADVDAVDVRGRTPFLVMQERLNDMHRKFGSAVFKTSQAEALHTDLNKASKWLNTRGCTYFVATHGNDTNSGQLQSPLRTITAAVELVKAGDTIVVRGGTYSISSAIDIDVSGEQSNPIRLEAYPEETPVFDFAKAKGASISITGAYWHIKGLVITNAQRPLQIHGSEAHHNILEQIVAFANEDIGICISADETAYNLILNCDAHSNFDFVTSGNGGDGFTVCNSVGPGNVLIGNRSWNNADDGYDLWQSNNTVRLERCYSWRNGENIWNFPLFGGDGNGFKLGPGTGKHLLISCMTWGHRYIGYNLNGNTEGVILRNCTAWNNGTNYAFNWRGFSEEGRKNCVFINNVSYRGKRSEAIHTEARNQNNSWDAATGITLNDDDFLSLDDSKMSAPRNPDGSIPYNDFLKLAPGSAAIDKGVDVGMPFVGTRPDLGAFEYDPNETSEGYIKMLHQAVRDHDLKQIEQLLAQGEGINDKDWLGYAPLHWACYFGYADLAERLIAEGADANLISDTGRTPLEIANAMEYTTIADLLLKLGAHQE